MENLYDNIILYLLINCARSFDCRLIFFQLLLLSITPAPSITLTEERRPHKNWSSVIHDSLKTLLVSRHDYTPSGGKRLHCWLLNELPSPRSSVDGDSVFRNHPVVVRLLNTPPSPWRAAARKSGSASIHCVATARTASLCQPIAHEVCDFVACSYYYRSPHTVYQFFPASQDRKVLVPI
jgi:hypothetical protein